jgi:hypothetical protein
MVLFTSNQYAQNNIDDIALKMNGRFNTVKQAETDSNFRKISLVMYPLSSLKDSVLWIYVEQALYDKKDKPYRQRFYKLKQEGKMWVSYVYEIKNAENWINYPDNPTSCLTCNYITDAILKKGCEVKLVKSDEMYIGGTISNQCPSNLYGAVYATSEVRLTQTELFSLDRGYNSAGQQVWGSKHGAYRFEKEENSSFDYPKPKEKRGLFKKK